MNEQGLGKYRQFASKLNFFHRNRLLIFLLTSVARWIKTKLSKTKEELEQRLIVTFSFKYRDYLRYTREKQIARAESVIKRGVAGKYGKGQNDPKRFIKR